MFSSEENKLRILRERMVETQIIARGIKDTKVIKALKKVPRHLFVGSESSDETAYEDYPISIGFSQTISQPYIVALMTELLEIQDNDRILEIGTGSGYQTAILAEIAKEVFTVEFIYKLSVKSESLLKRMGYTNIYFKAGDGYEGWPEFSPFNKIIVTAAPDHIPEKLKEQLADNGKMVLPVGSNVFNQCLVRLNKSKNKSISEEICTVSFVPMVKNKFQVKNEN
ncbi:MAG TPA: protein-L-isoaspartate O-methyltransferase [Actinobacteria bacterium]|nr:protein-L-isoaspartate O-methyltransferase [Actinomycetota bacterium]